MYSYETKSLLIRFLQHLFLSQLSCRKVSNAISFLFCCPVGRSEFQEKKKRIFLSNNLYRKMRCFVWKVKNRWASFSVSFSILFNSTSCASLIPFLVPGIDLNMISIHTTNFGHTFRILIFTPRDWIIQTFSTFLDFHD